jgi:glycosyltransferase involved in cell wall biosynthesis
MLFLANLSPNKFGSFEEQTLFLCAEMVKRGNNFFLCFSFEPEPDIKRRFEEAGATILTMRNPGIKSGGFFQNLKDGLSLYRLIRKNNISLVSINFFSVTSLRLWGVFFSSAQIVFTEHTSGTGKLQRGVCKYCLLKTVHYFIAKRVSLYIAVSDYVRNRLRQTHYVGDKKVKTIHLGVNLERFKPENIKAARRKLNLAAEKMILCSVANLIPEKGIQHLLQAISRMVNSSGLKDLLLLLVGEGYYRGFLENQIMNLGISDHVTFLGKRDDVQAIIAASDVVVVPSVWEEAFGLIIAEAMACAKPIIASNIGGIPELLQNEVTGITVKPGDVDQLTAAINRLIESPGMRQSMGQAGLAEAIKRFDLVKYVEKLASLYDSILVSS